jgi:branched-chain amino acid transport system ATP-binding protein
MSVRENLEIGAQLRNDRPGIEADIEHVFSMFPRLRERVAQKAGTLSGGEQQMLAIGRALMAKPSVLLMDEPSMGLAPILVEQVFETIDQISKEGLTILVVEQNANVALSIADRGYVIQTGRIVMKDTAEALLANPELSKAYLGELEG